MQAGVFAQQTINEKSLNQASLQKNIHPEAGNAKAELATASEPKSVTLSIKLPFKDNDYHMALSDNEKSVRLPCNTLTDNFTLSRALADHFPQAWQDNLHVSLRSFLKDDDGTNARDVKDCLEMLLKVRDKYTFGFRVSVDDGGVVLHNRVNMSNASKFRVIAWFYELAERDKPPLDIDFRY
jgi:hypothetical protein